MSKRLAVAMILSASVSGAAAGAAVQWTSIYLGHRIHVGDNTPAQTAAQIQAVGQEGGLAAVSYDPLAEVYLVGFQQLNGTSGLQKNFSISTVVADPDPGNGYFVTRFNTGYMVNGKQVDNVQWKICGGHGSVWNSPRPKAQDCPGNGRLLLMGDVHIRGSLTVNGTRLR